MSELKFIETTDETIYTDILEELENGVGEPLYPGDERRIFGDTMAKVIVTVYNTVNDACPPENAPICKGHCSGRSGRKQRRGSVSILPMPLPPYGSQLPKRWALISLYRPDFE